MPLQIWLPKIWRSCHAKGDDAEADGVHPAQERRYYSCLIDPSCDTEGLRRTPRLKVELPGYPILGDGKGDNQNHAIIFTRGSIIQCIDANQGGYFEQMLLLPCALGEFRQKEPGLNPRIVPWLSGNFGVLSCSIPQGQFVFFFIFSILSLDFRSRSVTSVINPK